MHAKHCVIIHCVLLSITALSQAGQVETYLPLHVGNSWTYVDNNGATRTFTIIAAQEINGRLYFEYDDFFSPCGFPGGLNGNQVRYLFRRDPVSDILLQYDSATDSDVVRYDFSGMNWGPFGNQLIERSFEFSTPAGEFVDCVKFAYAMFVDCGVFHETLAPGVGTVGFYSSWDGEYRLQHYSIVPEPDTSLGLVIMILIGMIAFRSPGWGLLSSQTSCPPSLFFHSLNN